MGRPSSLTTRWIQLALALAFVWTTTACGCLMREPTFRGGPNLNPGLDGKPGQVKVRVFLLKDRQKFDEAKLEMLWVDDRQSMEKKPPQLGDDCIAVYETRVYANAPPKNQDPLMVEILKSKRADAKFMGVVANFNPPRDDATYKYVVSCQEYKKKGKIFFLDEKRIQIEIDHHSTDHNPNDG